MRSEEPNYYEEPDYCPRPARYWHTTIAGVGRETGKGYRPGVCTYPRAQSPTPSAFHPVRTKTSRFKDKYRLAEEKPREIPAAERGVNVGDKGLYVFERKGTALWSSVLEGMPAREEPPPVNSNWMSAHHGDPKVFVRERQHTLLQSSQIEQMALAHLTPPATAHSISISNLSAASSRAMLSKVEALEVALAREEQRRATLVEQEQVRARLAMAAAGRVVAPTPVS